MSGRLAKTAACSWAEAATYGWVKVVVCGWAKTTTLDGSAVKRATVGNWKSCSWRPAASLAKMAGGEEIWWLAGS